MSVINIILQIVCLLISMKLFWNTAVFVDEHNLSPDLVLGGMGGLIMSWIVLGLLTAIIILTCITFVKKK
ncbi:hypothetical protein [Candidatus Galacturonibacter soehngenii]|uniref:Uncharacterized protein n=1 Tax=Candidatus Galacturonatibacter soehngenii TaxID=2307010 RepID=A0A7V7UFR2_9FIRM|nr:hypothetical protein [Candidatus Galacturonibacter soehngenii]KAB1437741.1 hypothetical protein F7O84_09075 [Candidatus Galacturonibacter soehngenii]MBA4686974.1 hypothetical protein [Candidatus Galacturonibacter soehngenii]